MSTMTHVDVAIRLLNDAAAFFKNLAGQNKDIADEMTDNANIFTKMAQVLGEDPTGTIEQEPNNQLAGRLLSDAAKFFVEIANHNDPIKDQMIQNAHIYENVSILVREKPLEPMAVDG